MKTELNGYFSIQLYAAMIERENFIQSNEQIKLEASGHALIYFFSFFGFQKTFRVILEEMNLIWGPVQTPKFSWAEPKTWN